MVINHFLNGFEAYSTEDNFLSGTIILVKIPWLRKSQDIRQKLKLLFCYMVISSNCP